MAKKEKIEVKKKEDKITKIAELPGVGPATVEKLEEAGFLTLMSIAASTKSNIMGVTGMGEPTVRKLINVAKNNVDMGYKTGLEVEKEKANVFKIPLLENMDNLLGGGFESKTITECYGKFGSGKTQISHKLSVNVQKMFPGCKVFWVDTENCFRPNRIRQFARGVGLDEDETVNNIIRARAHNTDHQIMIVEDIEKLIAKEKYDIKLIVVDSLTSHFRAEFIGRGTLADRQQKINQHMHALLKIADLQNIAVYVTNQVLSDPSAMYGDPIRAIGGNVVGHSSTTRIYLRKGKKGTIVAKLVDSPDLPDGETIFQVCEEDLKNV